MTADQLAVAAPRWLEDVGLLWFVGVVLMRRLAVAQPPALPWARQDMRQQLALALIGGLVTVAQAPSWFGAARVVAEGAAFFLCARGGGRGAVPLGFVAVVLLSPAGHAVQMQPVVPAVFVDELHVLSAGMWAGGVVVLATLRPPNGWRSDEGQDLLTRFGRVAMVAFAVTAMTGLLRATEELTGFSDLWQTAYGIVLMAKSVGVLAMLALAAVTWRRGVPMARSDALIALAVMAATGLLAAFPNPPAGA